MGTVFSILKKDPPFPSKIQISYSLLIGEFLV